MMSKVSYNCALCVRWENGASLTGPPAATALVVGDLAAVKGKSRGLDAVAGADLSRGDFTDAADDVAAGSDVELASVVADGEAVDDGAESESNSCRLHCVYMGRWCIKYNV